MRALCKIVFSGFLLCNLSINATKVLHLSFHQGCIKDFEYVAQQLGFELTSLTPHNFLLSDGKTKGNAVYNISHERAAHVWNTYKDFFDQFDVIITSDTAPLSRIFLQGGWKKPLIVWICNRFDYCDRETFDGSFPDKEYYELFNDGFKKPNVRIVAYTPFEHYYAQQKNVATGSLTIKPCAKPSSALPNSLIPVQIHKSKTFFIPPYLNDTHYFNMSEICKNLNIPVYAGRYNGPADLKDFKGIIHLPYAWSNLALFENLSNEIPYFIPSKKFILQLKKSHAYFFHDLSSKTIELSEWYLPEHESLFVYFDSWQDLAHKIKTTDFNAMKQKILAFAEKHHNTMLTRWKNLFKEFGF